MLVLWFGAWGAMGLSGLLPASLTAAVLVVVFGALFGLGETLLQPTLPAITNDMAPDHLRGRVNAAQSTAFMSGGVLGPLVAGVLLDRGLGGLFIGLIVAGLVVTGWLLLRLERIISPEVNGIAAQPLEPAEA